MYIPEQHTHIVHQQMLREMLEQRHMPPRRVHKDASATKPQRLPRAPAICIVKLGRTLERFGQTYLEDTAAC